MALPAARNFITNAAIATGIEWWKSPMSIFNDLNQLSSLMYEREVSSGGTLLLVNPGNNGVCAHIRFASCVPLSESRWSRKILQMASSEYAILAGGDGIWGLGELNTTALCDGQGILQVDFPDHHHWVLRHDGVPLLDSKLGVPTLHQDEIRHDRFIDSYQRLFPDIEPDVAERVFELIQEARKQTHGSTLVLAQDAALEAVRLQGQGTRIEPKLLTCGMFRKGSSIDGAVLACPNGVCHAIGVILDGQADPTRCTPSRGSRYNSALRYVDSCKPRLAVVVSDDRTVNVISRSFVLGA